MNQAFPEKIRDVTQGFMEAKIVLAAVDLELFDRLSRGQASVQQLVADLKVSTRGIEILADALAASGYLTKDDGLYGNTSDVERYLVRGRPDSLAFITSHRNQMFKSWSLLEEVIRHGKQSPEREKATLTHRETNRSFILGMAEVSRGKVGAVLDHLPLSEARLLVDLGGGPGHYACEAVRTHPDLRALLVDLDLTVDVAREYIDGQGLAGRVETRVCDFYEAESIDFGEPADLVLISQVLHAEGPDENLALLGKVRACMCEGGTLAIVENLIQPDRTRPVGAAMFAVNMLAGTVRGRTYTAEEVSGWLGAVGLRPEPVIEIADRTWLTLAHKEVA